MIIRGSIECDICAHGHTLRIGMGNEEISEHRFICRGCSQGIGVRLVTDFININSRIEPFLNCHSVGEASKFSIVNLDALFLIPREMQGQDGAFPRLIRGFEIAERAEKRGQLNTVTFDKLMQTHRPYRRADYAAEWRDLNLAWSLSKPKPDLSTKRVKEASSVYYADEPLDDLADWLWRFSTFSSRPIFGAEFVVIMNRISPVFVEKNFVDLMGVYEKHFANDRARKYRELFSQFYSLYDQFSQVALSVKLSSEDLEISDIASSIDFGKVKMFYGNAFEIYGNLIELLAFMNNVLNGRKFDHFNKLSLNQYRSLDKSCKTNAFADNADFMAICGEYDNRIRNASHHDGLFLSEDGLTLTYYEGKAEKRAAKTMHYIRYLHKSVKMFYQINCLFQIELLLHVTFRNSFPNIT